MDEPHITMMVHVALRTLRDRAGRGLAAQAEKPGNQKRGAMALQHRASTGDGSLEYEFPPGELEKLKAAFTL